MTIRTEPLPGLDVLTASEIRCWRACAKRHELAYRLGYRLALDDGPRGFGSLIHLALEAWWRSYGATGQADLDAALSALDQASDPFDRARARAMILGYHHRWVSVLRDFEVLGVELTWFTPLVNPATGAPSRTYQLGGKLDVLVRVAGGRLVVVEHKTTSEDVGPGSTYWKRLRLDAQASQYFDAVPECQGLIYDVLRKPQLRPGTVALTDEDGTKIVLDATGNRVRTKDGKKWRQTGDADLGYVLQVRPETPDEYEDRCLAAIGEDPDRYFARGDVVRLDGHVADFRADVWATAGMMRDSARLGRTPKNPAACFEFNSECAFWSVCTGEASLDDDRYRRIPTRHPELQPAA